MHGLRLHKPIPPLNARCAWFPTVRKNPALRGIPLEVAAIKFEEIYNERSGLIREYDLHAYLEIPLKTKIIVTFNIKDKILENLWLTFRRGLLKLLLKPLKADYICSPNFSCYFDTPRYAWWRNIWRNVMIAREFQELGFKVILDVSSPVQATHNYYIDLIEKNRIKCLMFNCQTLKLNRHKRFAYERFRVFDRLPMDVEFIITGLTSLKEAEPIYKTLHRKIYFTSSSPFLKAICQQTLRSHRRVTESAENLARKYFAYFNNLHLGLRNAYKHTGKKAR